MKAIFYGAALALLAQAHLPAAAAGGPAYAPPSKEVRYSDLDLRTQLGVDRLDRRIASAIVEVCGGPAPANTLDGAVIRQCRKDTAAATRPQRDQVIYLARSGTSGAPVVAMAVAARLGHD